MITMVGNTKGGVGKTTLAVQLAGLRAQAGRQVWLIDADSQGTAGAAMTARSEDPRLPGIAWAAYNSGQQLRSQVLHQRDRWDDIVIDVGGRDSSAIRAALLLADVLVVPFAPRSYDIWALTEMAALVAEARGLRDGLRACVVINQADTGRAATYNVEAAAAVADHPEFELLPTPICRRMAVSHASAGGAAVTEVAARDAKAVAELHALAAAIYPDTARLAQAS